MKVNALVLAGQPNNGALKEISPVANEAFIEIGNRMMLEYVLDALASADGVERIVVVGPKKELEEKLQDRDLIITQSAATLVDNVLVGAGVLPHDRKILIVTSDIPLLTGEIVDDFINQCCEEEADFYYPAIEKTENEKKYPMTKRTYVRLKEGTFTGGNLALVNPGVLGPSADMVRAFVAARKNPLKLAALLGWTFVIKLLFHRLSLSQLEKRFSELFDLKAVVVLTPHPEIGLDVDKPSDYKLVRAALL